MGGVKATVAVFAHCTGSSQSSSLCCNEAMPAANVAPTMVALQYLPCQMNGWLILLDVQYCHISLLLFLMCVLINYVTIICFVLFINKSSCNSSEQKPSNKDIVDVMLIALSAQFRTTYNRIQNLEIVPWKLQ
jgi:hypothetical protein